MSTVRMLHVFSTHLETRLNNLYIDPSFDINRSLQLEKDRIFADVNTFKSKIASADLRHADIEKAAIDKKIDGLYENYKKVSDNAISSKARELVDLDRKVELLDYVNTDDWFEAAQSDFEACKFALKKSYATYRDANDKEKIQIVATLGKLKTVASVMPVIISKLNACKIPISCSYTNEALAEQANTIRTHICVLIKDYSATEHDTIMQLIKKLRLDIQNSIGQSPQYKPNPFATFCSFDSSACGYATEPEEDIKKRITPN